MGFWKSLLDGARAAAEIKDLQAQIVELKVQLVDERARVDWYAKAIGKALGASGAPERATQENTEDRSKAILEAAPRLGMAADLRRRHIEKKKKALAEAAQLSEVLDGPTGEGN